MTDMADPYYADMKQHKRDADWLYAYMYANYCIPKKCTCGGAITVETDERARNYSVCKVFEVRLEVNLIDDDGLHIRHAYLDAIEEEVDILKTKYREEVSLRRKLQYEVEEMRKDIQELKNLVMRVREYNTLFLKSGLHEKYDEETLVSIYRDGLRDDIRKEIGSQVFTTIDGIMQEALDVEEGETPSDTNGSTTESDESGDRPQKKARIGDDFLDNVDEEEEDEAKEDDNDADHDSDGSLLQPLGGSDDDSDSKVDLEDYKEDLEEHHRTDSESSPESK
ncbi:hypothetical protein Bca4012_065180 [Brassica carinata]